MIDTDTHMARPITATIIRGTGTVITDPEVTTDAAIIVTEVMDAETMAVEVMGTDMDGAIDRTFMPTKRR